MLPLEAAAYARIDQALAVWRQGDCVLGEHWFLFRVEPEAPLTPAGAIAAAEGVDAAEDGVLGFMLATQSCDIVRRCAERPFVEVSPLVPVDDATLREIERGRRPNYAFVPGVADRLLVADLDRVMTVEKAVVAGWERVAGCRSDGEVHRLSLALARKRARVAFPDDFVSFASELVNRMSSKHDKESDEGRALRGLREIRVRAAPSWNDAEVELTFWFIRRSEDLEFEKKGWGDYLDAWLKRVEPSGRFKVVNGLVQTLDDLTAREYVESDPLDLDHLSGRETLIEVSAT